MRYETDKDRRSKESRTAAMRCPLSVNIIKNRNYCNFEGNSGSHYETIQKTQLNSIKLQMESYLVLFNLYKELPNLLMKHNTSS